MDPQPHMGWIGGMRTHSEVLGTRQKVVCPLPPGAPRRAREACLVLVLGDPRGCRPTFVTHLLPTWPLKPWFPRIGLCLSSMVSPAVRRRADRRVELKGEGVKARTGCRSGSGVGPLDAPFVFRHGAWRAGS